MRQVARGVYIKIKKISVKAIVLVFFASVLAFTSAMPDKVLALGVFDQKPQPKEPSVLSAQKVDIAKTQAIVDTSNEAVQSPKKQDRTKVRELIEERTANSSTFLNKDGTKTYEYSVRQKNFRSGNKWEKINNTLSPVAQEAVNPSLWQTLTNTLPEQKPVEEFSGKAGSMGVRMMPLSKGVSMQLGGKTVTMKPIGAANVRPEKKDTRTTIYKNAWKGVDLEYQTEGELVKENIIIKNRDIAGEFEFKVAGAKLIDDPKNIGSFTLEGAQDGYRFGGLTLALKDKGPIEVPAESLKQERTANNSIKVHIDKKWIASLPDSSFPLVIDPSFGRWDANNTDWMFKSDGYSCNGSNCWIQAGTLNDGGGWKHWRSYIHLPYPELAGGKRVLNANIHAYYNPNANPDPHQRYLFFGHANCIGWECRGKHLATVLTAGDFDVNVTGELQQAVNAGNMGATWSFWGEEVPYKTFKTYSDMHLSVVYDTPTPIATPATPANGQVIVDTQPTLRVNPVGDADGDAVQYYFRVSTGSNAESGAVINSGWINSNTWTIPDGILQDGTTYYWHVYTQGATQTNPNWVSSFKIDLRTGKDSTQAYDTVGPVGVALATGNATTSTSTHSMDALGGSIGLNLDYDSPAKSKPGLIGEYFNVSQNNANPAEDAVPALTRHDKEINFTWPHGTSPGNGVNPDWFTARWKGYFVAPNTGTYYFGTSLDDGAYIKVNNQDVSGGCYGATPCYGNGIQLNAGQIVPLRVQFTEATGDGYIRLYVKGAVPEQIVPRDWLRTEVKAVPTQYGLQGRYYTDDGSHTFPGNDGDPMRLMMAQSDSKLAFNWGAEGPASGLQGDRFMVKWTGYITVPSAGSYTLGATSDDGVRIKVNNGLLGAENTVLNAWQDQATTVWGNATNLPAKEPIPITIEYFENGGGAQFTLRVQGNGYSDQEIPISWLTPKAAVLPDAWRLGVDVDGDVNYERLRMAGQDVILEDSTRSTHTYTWTGSGYKPPVNEDGRLTRNADNTFTLLDTDGRTYVFDAEGKLRSVTSPTDDRKPASLNYIYGGSPSRLERIEDGVTNSRYGTLHYAGINEGGNCAVPSGYDLAPVGMLCAFKTSDGDITKLHYKQGQLARVEKPGEERSNFGYDEVGRIITMRDSVANDAVAAGIRNDDSSVLTEITYDQIGRTNTVTAPAASANAARVSHAFEYQSSGAVPLHRHAMGTEHKASITPNIPGYLSEGRFGWLLSESKPGTHPLYSCQIQWDEFISFHSNCEGQKVLGLLGYAYDNPVPGVTVPVYRCLVNGTGDHMISLAANCENQHNEGLHGHILIKPEPTGATQMHVTGAPEPNGFSKRIEYDELWRTIKETDIANVSNLTEWDLVKDLELSKTDATGLKTTTIYDDEDRPLENYGPAPAAWYETSGVNVRKPLSAYTDKVPKTATSYDEGIVGPEVTYYNYKADNKTLIGAPKLRTTGFADSNGTVATPGVMMKVWGANRPITPDNGMSGWGLRANGKLRVPTNANYTFHFWHDDGIRVYLDDTLLAEDWNNGGYRRLDASRTLEAGKVYRFTVEYYDADNNATLDLFVSAPNAIPVGDDRDWSAELKPGFGLKTSETAFDADAQLGNVTTKTTYSKPEYGLVDKTILDPLTGQNPNALNLQTTATYETPGAGYLRQTSKTLPGGGTTQYQHYPSAGNDASRDNPCTTETETIHQGGRPKGKIEADPDGAGPQTPRTSETVYNASGEVVATKYNNDDWTCTEYDSRGRVQRTIVPVLTENGITKAGRTITNDYAKDGNPLITTTTDNQGTIRVENDLLGRTVKYTDVHGKTTENTYDVYGKLTSRTSSIGTESYEYDQYDRLTKHKLDGVTFATVTYDQYSRLAGVQYPAGISLSSITRDILGRENSTAFSVNGQTYTDSIERFVSGDIKQGTENGTTKTYQYDNAGRLTSATIGSNTFSYEFGTPDVACNGITGNNPNTAKNGNRTKVTINGQVTTYCYDMADRLIGSSDSTLTNTRYDSRGNAISLGDATHKTEFGYDASDRNTKISAGNKETLFARDAQDRIIGREHKVNGATVSNAKYSFTGSGDSPDALLDASGNVTQKYLTLPGDVLVTIKPNSTSAGATTYSLPNIHGDIYLTVDADGQVKSTHQTGPFGEALLNQQTPQNTSAGTTWNYVGQHQKLTDTEASSISGGIIQMGARVYIPVLGRFLSMDPIEGAGDNAYVYVNDPVNEEDLDGKIAPLVAFAAWQLGRIAVQQAVKVAVQHAAKQAAQQVVKKAVVHSTKKVAQKAAPKKTTLQRAADLGYKKTKDYPKALQSKGNPVYVNSKAPASKRFISPDKTKHTGANQWKVFNTQGKRVGTYDPKLVRKIRR